MLPYLVVGLIVLAGFLLRHTVLASDPIEVRVAAVGRGRVEATVTNSKAGTVEARRRSRLASETGGRVVAIGHREGARVEAGEPLVRLNAATQIAQRDLARKAVEVAAKRSEEACLRRDRTARELARSQRLAEQGVVSEDRLDQLQYTADAARVACQAARAELARVRAQERAARVELDKTVIRAPFSGVIAEVNVEVGEWVTPSPPLLTSPAVIDLIDPTSIYVSAPMDEVDASAIEPGLPAKVTIDSHPGEVFEGTVSRVAPYVVDVEAQNRTLEIDVTLDDEQRAQTLLPGTSADVEVILEAREDVLRIPTSALLQSQRVLRLEEGRLVEQDVRLGLRNWQFAEVTSGLSEGDPIVVSLDRVEIEAGARATAAAGDREGAP